MKRLIIGGLSALILAAAHAPAATAQRTALTSTTLRSTTTRALTPFNLVSLANQGYFKNQGIPSSGALMAAHRAGRVSAEDIVKSAVATNRLSLQVLNDQGYLRAVNAQLSALESNR